MFQKAVLFRVSFSFQVYTAAGTRFGERLVYAI